MAHRKGLRNRLLQLAKIGLAFLLAPSPGVAAAPNRASASESESDLWDAIANTREVSHHVTLTTAESDVAIFSVTREYRPIAPDKPICLNDIAVTIPDNAVITAFEVQTDGAWRKGRLRREASAPFQKGPANCPWVSLSWSGTGPDTHGLSSPVFQAKGAVRVRYTFWAQATRTLDGAQWIYCRPDEDAIHDQTPDVTVLTLAPKLTVRRASDPERRNCTVIEKPLPPPLRLTARYGRRSFDDVWWWRIESTWPLSLDASEVLQPGPVVFVLDASKSQLRRAGLAIQLELVKALVAERPHANVEIVVFGRRAQRLFGRFVIASDLDSKVLATLEQAGLQNGSALEQGTGLAADALATLGKPGRIIVVTDGEVRSRFSAASAIAQLRHAPNGTRVDLVEPRVGTDHEIAGSDPRVKSSYYGTGRFDVHGVKRLAAAFGGGAFAVTVGMRPNPKDPSLRELLAAALLGHAIRPESWDAIAVYDKTRRVPEQWPRLDFTHGNRSFVDELMLTDAIGDQSSVTAGETQVWTGFSDVPPPTRLSLTGWAWGRKVALDLVPNSEFEARMARLANSEHSLMHCFSSGKHQQYARAAGFLAPGLEFWVSGTEENDDIGEGGVALHDDSCSPGGYGRGEGAGRTPDPFPDVTRQLLPCGMVVRTNGEVRLTVETRSEEILDVYVTGGDDAARHCIEEALWSVSLPTNFNEAGPNTYTLSLGRLQ